MNWKLRFKNKATLTALITAVVAFVYQICGIIGVVPAVSQSNVVDAVGLIINILAMLGIVVDPTTQGIGDSELAQDYDEPAEKTKIAE